MPRIEPERAVGTAKVEGGRLPQAEFEQKFTKLFAHIKRVKRDTVSGTLSTVRRGDLLLPVTGVDPNTDDLFDVDEIVVPHLDPPSRAGIILSVFELQRRPSKEPQSKTFVKPGRGEKDTLLQIGTRDAEDQPLILTLAFDSKAQRNAFNKFLAKEQEVVIDRLLVKIDEGIEIEQTHEELGTLYMMPDGLMKNLMTLNKDKALLQKAAEALALREFTSVTEGTVIRVTNPIINDVDALRYVVALLEDADGNILLGREHEHQRLTQRIAQIREQNTREASVPINAAGLPVKTGVETIISEPHVVGEPPKAKRLNRFQVDRLVSFASPFLGKINAGQRDLISLGKGPQELLAPIVSKALGREASLEDIKDFFIKTAQDRKSTLTSQKLAEIFYSNKWKSIFEEK